ncbi:MAG: hypothetical protein AB7S78_10395 [Candidatus Omnitrophota bacterium]
MPPKHAYIILIVGLFLAQSTRCLGEEKLTKEELEILESFEILENLEMLEDDSDYIENNEEPGDIDERTE